MNLNTRQPTSREIEWRGARYRFSVGTNGSGRSRTLSVTVDDQPLTRLEVDRELELETLGRLDLERLAERARKEAALNRWEGEGGRPVEDPSSS